MINALYVYSLSVHFILEFIQTGSNSEWNFSVLNSQIHEIRWNTSWLTGCNVNMSDSEARFSSHGWCEQSDHPFLWAQVSLSLARRRSMRSPLSIPLWRFHWPFIWACDGSNNISITLKPNQAEEMLILPCTRCWENWSCITTSAF